MSSPDYFANDSRTNRQRMLDEDFYIGDDPENARIAQKAIELSEQYRLAIIAGNAQAREILCELLGSFGADSYIKPPLSDDYGENLHVGDRTFINMNLVALDVAAIYIGDDCQIGPNVQLLTPIHPLAHIPRRDKLEAARSIRLGNNVWLGGGVIVCPGVTIGDNTVVGAGSVVTRDLPANVVAVGTPARVVKHLDPEDTRLE